MLSYLKEGKEKSSSIFLRIEEIISFSRNPFESEIPRNNCFCGKQSDQIKSNILILNPHNYMLRACQDSLGATLQKASCIADSFVPIRKKTHTSSAPLIAALIQLKCSFRILPVSLTEARPHGHQTSLSRPGQKMKGWGNLGVYDICIVIFFTVSLLIKKYTEFPHPMEELWKMIT